MTTDLDAILGYVAALKDLDTSAVEPMTHAVPFDCPERPDQVGTSLPIDEALANAPRREASFFQVPRIIAPSAGGRPPPEAPARKSRESPVSMSTARPVDRGDRRWRARGQAARARRHGGVPRPHRAARRCAELLRAGRRRRRAPPRRRGRRRRRGRARSGRARGRADRHQGHLRHARSSRRRARRRSCAGSCRRSSRRSRSAWPTPARCRSASSTWTSSRWARRTRTARAVRCATPGRWRTCPADRRAARRLRSRRRCARARPAPTPADRSASRRRSAASPGMKPTYGRVSRYGVIAFASSLDHPGPFGRSVEDVAALLEVMAGADPLDATSIPAPVGRYREACRAGKDGLQGVRLGIPDEYFQPGMDAEVEAAVRAALDELGARGREAGAGLAAAHQVRHRDLLPHLHRRSVVEPGALRRRALRPSHEAIRARSRSSTRARAARVSGSSPSGASCSARTCCAPATTRRTTARRCACGRKIADDFTAAFTKCDAIVTPTSPIPAFRFGERMGDPLQMYLADVLTVAPNLAGVPALAQRCGFTQERAADRPADHRAGAGRGGVLPRRRRLRGAHGVAPRGCRPTPSHGEGGVMSVDKYEVVIGLEVHAQLSTQSKIFSWSSAAFGAEPNTHDRSGLPGHAGHAAGAEPRGGRVGGAPRAGGGLHDPPALPLRAQALLLSGPAQGLSDLAVRRADLRGRRDHVPPARRARGRCA